MNLHTTMLSSLCLSLFAFSAAAGTRPAPLAEIIVDCGTRALPSQADVGSMLGIDNFSAAYAARNRLMVDVARACQREGSQQVRVTLAPSVRARSADRRPLARADRNTRR